MINSENSRNQKHVSKEIIGQESNVLKGMNIVLCITASVAAYKAIDLSRMLMRYGAEVYPVMSKSTNSKLLTAEIMNWATGNKTITELTSELEHITLANYGKSDSYYCIKYLFRQIKIPFTNLGSISLYKPNIS